MQLYHTQPFAFGSLFPSTYHVSVNAVLTKCREADGCQVWPSIKDKNKEIWLNWDLNEQI